MKKEVVLEELDNKVVMMYGILPLIPYLVFDSFVGTIVLSVVITFIYAFIVLKDDKHIVYTEEELIIKRLSFKWFLFVIHIPIWILYALFLFKTAF